MTRPSSIIQNEQTFEMGEAQDDILDATFDYEIRADALPTAQEQHGSSVLRSPEADFAEVFDQGLLIADTPPATQQQQASLRLPFSANKADDDLDATFYSLLFAAPTPAAL